MRWGKHDLEVIARDGEHADTLVVSLLLSLGLIYQDTRRARLSLTQRGREAMK